MTGQVVEGAACRDDVDEAEERRPQLEVLRRVVHRALVERAQRVPRGRRERRGQLAADPMDVLLEGRRVGHVRDDTPRPERQFRAGIRAITTMRSRKSGAHIRSATPDALGAAHERAAGRRRVAPDPLEVVADGERLRLRARRRATSKPWRPSRVRRLARVKYWTWVGMTDHQRAPIARATRLPASGSIRQIAPPGASSARDAVERLARTRQVLDHVAEHDRVEAAAVGRSAVQQVVGPHVEPQPVARVGRGELARLDADHVPAAVARLGEQEADPAAEIEQRAARRRGARAARARRAPSRAGRPPPRRSPSDAASP